MAAGFSLSYLAATPDLFPCMFAAPLYACTRHREIVRLHLVRRSLITMNKVSAFVFGTLNNPSVLKNFTLVINP